MACGNRFFPVVAFSALVGLWGCADLMPPSLQSGEVLGITLEESLASLTPCPTEFTPHPSIVQYLYETHNYRIYICSGNRVHQKGYCVFQALPVANLDAPAPVLILPVHSQKDGEFIAQANDITYTLTPERLVVSDPIHLKWQEPVVRFQNFRKYLKRVLLAAGVEDWVG